MTYKTWYKTKGHRLEEDLRIWLESKPKWLNPNDIEIYDEDEFVFDMLEKQYNLNIDYFGNVQDEA